MDLVAERRLGPPSITILQANRLLDGAPRGWLVIALLLIQALLHWPFLDLPPSGIHLWRQTQTLSVARNFSEEGMNPFYPRIDSRGCGDGVTGMEFPLVNIVIAMVYLPP